MSYWKISKKIFTYRYIWLWSMPSSKLFKWHTVRRKSEVDEEIRLSDRTNNATHLPLGICSCSSPVPPCPLHSQKWVGTCPSWIYAIWRQRLWYVVTRSVQRRCNVDFVAVLALYYTDVYAHVFQPSRTSLSVTHCGQMKVRASTGDKWSSNTGVDSLKPTQ